MTPYANTFTQKVASLYGLKSSQQGSSRKRFVMVAATQRTRLLGAAERERLAELLSLQEAAVRALRPLAKQPPSSGRHLAISTPITLSRDASVLFCMEEMSSSRCGSLAQG
jgi:hypothetical protein